MKPPLTPTAHLELRRAREMLESPGLLIQAANLLGAPVEHLITKRLPKRAGALVERATTAAVGKAFDAAAATMRKDKLGAPARPRAHQLVAVSAGAVGGFFGWAGLALELPFTTATILRSVADIARAQGETPHAMQTRLACMEVLALGGSTPDDDGVESGYFATRAALAAEVSAVTRHLARHGLADKAAPVVMKLIQAIAARFSIPVSQKALLEAVPVIGAVTGASLNGIFIGHFQQVAEGHFIVRRLERVHGAAAVRRAWAAIS